MTMHVMLLSNHPPGFPSKPQVPLNSNFNNASSSSNQNAFHDKYDKMSEMLTTNMTALSKQQQELFNGQAELKKDNAELKKQVGDLVKQMSQNHTQGKLPAGTVPNPTYHQANAITTRSGKVLGEVVPAQEEDEVVEILRSQVEDDPATSKAENRMAKPAKPTPSAGTHVWPRTFSRNCQLQWQTRTLGRTLHTIQGSSAGSADARDIRESSAGSAASKFAESSRQFQGRTQKRRQQR